MNVNEAAKKLHTAATEFADAKIEHLQKTIEDYERQEMRNVCRRDAMRLVLEMEEALLVDLVTAIRVFRESRREGFKLYGPCPICAPKKEQAR